MDVNSGHMKADFGYCFWSFETDYVHIYDLFVYHACRGLGHGRNILKQAIREIRKAGYWEDICIVADPTDASVDRERLGRFYKEMGLDVYAYYG